MTEPARGARTVCLWPPSPVTAPRHPDLTQGLGRPLSGTGRKKRSQQLLSLCCPRSLSGCKRPHWHQPSVHQGPGLGDAC